jgi:hypothetical protein
MQASDEVLKPICYYLSHILLKRKTYGKAWEEICSSKYHNLRRSSFEKGGCGITATGKNDHLVKVENFGPVWPPAPGEPNREK